MKKLRAFVISWCLLAGLAACSGIKGEGPVITQNRSVDSFEGIEVANDVEVYLSQGDERSVRVEGQKNILDILETDVRSDMLKISYGRHNVRRHEPVRVHITNPQLEAVKVSGSSKVISKTKWRLDDQDFETNISGSGKLTLELLDADEIESSISGSGDMILRGDCSHFELTISGSGDVKAFDMTAKIAKISVSGSGSCQITVQKELDTRISGSGSVRYKGDPKTINTSVTGSGRAIRED